MSGTRRASGAREAEILAALWAAGRPLTPREVTAAVGDGLAYNTVQTILTRLHDKGAVHREAAGRAHAYTPVLDEAGLAARHMHALLDRGGDSTAVLSRFLGTLDAEQRRIFARLLRTDDEDA
ncbi:MAG: BlaI/MecI/CopY family transcriptional regulator [Streptosporangiales bacterium]|nr:BlaI/MecI/CopY family transcriptional regulator [Streptosporangiales bacterium]MBO0892000.1 BlaI/MecI/CopY family transcriptional regulator [Acidothermales bacterium]